MSLDRVILCWLTILTFKYIWSINIFTLVLLRQFCHNDYDYYLIAQLNVNLKMHDMLDIFLFGLLCIKNIYRFIWGNILPIQNLPSYGWRGGGDNMTFGRTFSIFFSFQISLFFFFWHFENLPVVNTCISRRQCCLCCIQTWSLYLDNHNLVRKPSIMHQRRWVLLSTLIKILL